MQPGRAPLPMQAQNRMRAGSKPKAAGAVDIDLPGLLHWMAVLTGKSHNISLYDCQNALHYLRVRCINYHSTPYTLMY
jgi:hypothetical protein